MLSRQVTNYIIFFIDQQQEACMQWVGNDDEQYKYEVTFLLVSCMLLLTWLLDLRPVIAV